MIIFPRHLFLYAAVAMSTVTADELISLLGPAASPTISSDFWACATENIDQYFEYPQPTGAVNSALLDYGDELLNRCTLTGFERLDCPFPEHSLWCGFTSVAPSTILSDYSAYGSQASEWLARHSASAVRVAEECPYTWWRFASDPLGAGRMLNFTIAMAHCYASAQVTGESTLPAGTTGPTGTTGNSPEETSPGAQNGSLRQGEAMQLWIVAAIGLAAVALA